MVLNLTEREVRQENVSFSTSETEGFEKSFLLKVLRLTTGEGLPPSPERISVLRLAYPDSSKVEEPAVPLLLEVGEVGKTSTTRRKAYADLRSSDEPFGGRRTCGSSPPRGLMTSRTRNLNPVAPEIS
jgi:hypothetical protein